jgi:homoserine kinase
MMSVVSVKVPATTANVGPGFDCLGIALKVYNVVSVRKGGESRDGMIAEAGEAFFRRAKKKTFGFESEITGDVPRSRGMGSSVTVRLGVLQGLNRLCGSPLDRQAVFELCAGLEGHPDNAASAAFGGFTIARPGAELQRYRVGDALSFVLLIPDFPVATTAARRVLPKRILREDAVMSAANASAIAGAFASRDYAKLAGCFSDGLHQPYREKLVPCLSEVIGAGEKAGALGGWLSGSGSTIACVTLGRTEAVARAMVKAARLPGAKVMVTKADNTGVRIPS